MTAREELLRARVYAALDARDAGDDDAFQAACADLVRGWIMFPLEEATARSERADALLGDSRTRAELRRLLDAADALDEGAWIEQESERLLELVERNRQRRVREAAAA